jgi:tetratricopeptide (TPR) repeat protein
MQKLALWIALAIVVPSGFAANADRQRAQALIKDGNALEATGNLLEARDKYTEALSYRAGFKELNGVNKKIAAKAAEIVKSAQASFDAKDYSKAIEQLQEAGKYSPKSPNVLCDLAVTYHSAGDDTKALDSLRSCIGVLEKKEEKARYEQLITEIETKDQPLKLDEGQKQALSAFNRELKENSENLPTAEADAGLCKKLMDNQTTLPKTSSVLFNLARCSEDDGKLEDAARYFAEYMNAAPDSRAVPEAKDAVAELTSILAFDGAKRDEVREHYRVAAQYLTKGKYDLALKEYEAVRAAAPDFAFGRRQLGLFYEAMEKTDEAAAELTAYSQIEGVSAEEKQWAAAEMASLPEKKLQYDTAVREASVKMRPMLLLGAPAADNPKTSDEVIKKLQSATGQFALGPEANRLLGFLYVESSYPSGAKHGYDAAVAGGANPFFFAWVSPRKGGKAEVFSLVVVKKDGLQIEPYFSPPKIVKLKKGQPAPAPADVPNTCESLSEGLVFSGPALRTGPIPPEPSCGDFLAVKDIKHIESKQLGIELQIPQEPKPVWLRPVNLFQIDPFQYGPAARKYANQYVRVIQRYMENDVTKLGAEHMTGGEKAVMGLMIASMAAGGVGGAMNAVNAAEAAIRVSTYAIQAMQLLQQYRRNNALLTQPGTYKPLPVDPAPLAFRAE